MEMKKLNILFIGASSISFGLVHSYLKAFEGLGVNVICFDPESELKIPRMSYELKKDLFVEKIKRRIAHYILHYKACGSLKREFNSGKFNQISLVIVFKCPWLNVETLFSIKEQSKIPFFHFNADSPFDKNPANSHPNLVRTLGLYDCYFIWSKSLIPKLYEAGAKRVEYLPFAWDPDLHSFKDNDIYFESDCSFVGNWSPEREMWLLNLTDFNLSIWGAYLWERVGNDSLLKYWKRKAPFAEEFAQIVRNSRINLNILNVQNKGSHNMRTFEVPGCGGFLLTERSTEQCEFFEEDKEIACFSTPEELREKVKFYLPKDELRRKMADAAHAKVAQRHTYMDRAKQMLKVYEDIVG